jgi:hypothetical protein
MGDSHIREIEPYHFPRSETSLGQDSQLLDCLIARSAFRDQRNGLRRLRAIGLFIELFNKDRHLHGFLPIYIAGMACSA